MTMTKDAVVDTLTRLAAGRGTLSAQELRQVVPLDAMSVDDIAALIAELEDRGVAVEIDPDFLSPRQALSPEARAAAAAAVRPRAAPPPPTRPAGPVAATSGSAAASSGATAASAAPQPSQRAVAIAVLAAAVVVVVLAALVWAF